MFLVDEQRDAKELPAKRQRISESQKSIVNRAKNKSAEADTNESADKLTVVKEKVTHTPVSDERVTINFKFLQKQQKAQATTIKKSSGLNVLTPKFSKEPTEHITSTFRHSGLDASAKIKFCDAALNENSSISHVHEFSLGKRNEAPQVTNIKLEPISTSANRRNRQKNPAQKSLLSLFENAASDQIGTTPQLEETPEINLDNLVPRDASKTLRKNHKKNCLSSSSFGDPLKLQRFFNESAVNRRPELQEIGLKNRDHGAILPLLSSPLPLKQSEILPSSFFSPGFNSLKTSDPSTDLQSSMEKYLLQKERLTEHEGEKGSSRQNAETSYQNTQELDDRYMIQREESATKNGNSTEDRQKQARIQELTKSPMKKKKVLRANAHRRRVSSWESLNFNNDQMQSHNSRDICAFPMGRGQERKQNFDDEYDSQFTPN